MTRTLGTASKRLYTLTVFLFDGPVTKAFARRNRIVSRTIQILGHQTLAQLHQAIFRAFDRCEQHFYEFQVGGNGPRDPKARRYVLPGAFEVQKADPDQRPAGIVTQTPIGALGLRRRQGVAARRSEATGSSVERSAGGCCGRPGSIRIALPRGEAL